MNRKPMPNGQLIGGGVLTLAILSALSYGCSEVPGHQPEAAADVAADANGVAGRWPGVRPETDVNQPPAQDPAPAGFFSPLPARSPLPGRTPRPGQSPAATPSPLPLPDFTGLDFTEIEPVNLPNGEAVFEHSFNEQEGVGIVFNQNSCKTCHDRGGIGGPDNQAKAVTRMTLADQAGNQRDLVTVNRDDMLPGAPLVQRRATDGDNEEAKNVLNAPFNLLTVARVPTETRGGGEIMRLSDAAIRAYAALQNPVVQPVRRPRPPLPPRNGPTPSPAATASPGPDSAQNARITGRPNELGAPGVFTNPETGQPLTPGNFPGLTANEIGRFGWKAHSPDYFDFIRDAALQEVGLSNWFNLNPDGFPNELLANQFNTSTRQQRVGGIRSTDQPDLSVDQFRKLVAFNASLPPVAPENRDDERVNRGKALFRGIGCAVCHHNYESAPAVGGGTVTVNAYSDFLLHYMGPDLADGFIMGRDANPTVPGVQANAQAATNPANVASGPATGGEWKTQVLWGLRFRSDFLHDGRAGNLDQAIRMHRESPQQADPRRQSEATDVVLRYEALSEEDQDAIQRFLETL